MLETNRRVQAQNNAPPDFPAFVRQGFDIKVLADGYGVDEKGLIFKVRLPSSSIFFRQMLCVVIRQENNLKLVLGDGARYAGESVL